jgi:hypothetical protein
MCTGSRIRALKRAKFSIAGTLDWQHRTALHSYMICGLPLGVITKLTSSVWKVWDLLRLVCLGSRSKCLFLSDGTDNLSLFKVSYYVLIEA